MNTLTKLTATATRVLVEHPDLPVAHVAIGWTSAHGTPGDAVQFQMPALVPPANMLATIAAWAQALDTTITLRGQDTYVWLGAVAEVDGCTVLAWDHLDLRDAVELTARLRLPLPATGEVVEIAPAVAQGTAGTLTGTAA